MPHGSSPIDTPIKATTRSIEIVEEIMRLDGAGVTELAEALGYSKSTIHDHLTTLRETNYVRREEGVYRIGLSFLTLGGHARRRNEIFEIAKGEVDDLVEETGESAKIAVEANGRGIYLYKSRGERAVRTHSHAGTRVYLHSTSVGKAILAHLPRERIEAVIADHGLPAWTEHTITDEAQLSQELEAVRERGYAIDNEERILGLRCVGAPVIRNGDVLGAISISGPKRRFDHAYLERMGTLVSDTARVIEMNAKYSRHVP